VGSTFQSVTDPPFDFDPLQYRYVQIADDIERQIRTGRLQPRAALPAIDRLAEDYGVARMTIIRATQLLVERGLVVVLSGRGTFVRETDVPDDAVRENPDVPEDD